MLLYHGTSGEVASLAKSDGLSPRAETGVASNWEDNPSSSELVYLTSVYAGYFAGMATEEGPWGIVEVDTSCLDVDNMRPDEDFLEQACTKAQTKNLAEEAGDEVLPTLGMEGRTAWFKSNIDWFDHLWVESVNRLGTCSYAGRIPPAAVTRVSLFDPKENQSLAWECMDPCISLINYKIMGQKYANLTRELMGDPTQETDMDRAFREAGWLRESHGSDS